ncbi:MAG: hypothetical protein B0D91_12975 [Oceanospirillales bacterium LUC14_002_19_P2]|nr:MAG: hypothetical protein B0D91_12975 [Oceanospirillales bacterium LUC14_002_19_P2]
MFKQTRIGVQVNQNLHLLGFIPGYVISFGMKQFNMLRVPEKVEALGLDLVEIPARPYPETVPAQDIVASTLTPDMPANKA